VAIDKLLMQKEKEGYLLQNELEYLLAGPLRFPLLQSDQEEEEDRQVRKRFLVPKKGLLRQRQLFEQQDSVDRFQMELVQLSKYLFSD
jgi:hypothetical protein